MRPFAAIYPKVYDGHDKPSDAVELIVVDEADEILPAGRATVVEPVLIENSR